MSKQQHTAHEAQKRFGLHSLPKLSNGESEEKEGSTVKK
jgi:hypothetical protein